MLDILYHHTPEELFTDSSSSTDFHLWHNTTTTFHDHTYYEINLIMKGSCYHIVENKKQLVSKGTVFIVPPGKAHRLVSIPNQTFSLANISIKAPSMEFLMLPFPQNFSDAIKDNIVALNLDKTDFIFLSDFIYHKLIPNIDLECFLAKMWTSTTLSLFYLDHTKNAISQFPAWFNEILDEMQSMENISKRLYEIPIINNYSPATLSKYFHQFLNTSPNDYFITLKMNYASQLLTKTDYTIFSISEMIGYTSLSHFNRIFRKTFNMTPSEYKQKSVISSQTK